MNKINRNDPCTCGSGKKYKNCCGTNRVIELNPNVINVKLNQLHQQLITYAFEQNKQKLNEQVSAYSKRQFKGQSDLADIYYIGLAIWIIFNVSFLKQNKSLFDAFGEKQIKSIDFEVRRNFRNWNHTVPSAYEVVSSKKSAEGSVMVKDLLTDKTYEVPINPEEPATKGTLFVGVLLPFMRFHNFFYTMIKLYNRSSKEVRDLIQTYAEKAGGLEKNFPDFLADALLGEGQEQEIEETQPAEANGKNDDQVSKLFSSHMEKKKVRDNVISKGISLWNKYYEQEKPSIKKVESYAAALEYFVQKHLLDNGSLTQSEVAQEYSVAPGTVSNNYRKLFEVIGEQ